MKKSIFFTLLFFGQLINAFPLDYIVDYHEQNQTLEFNIGNYQLTAYEAGTNRYTKIVFDGAVSTNKKGYAEVPFLHASIRLNPGKNITISLIAEEFTDTRLNNPLLPSRGVIYRDQDPAQIPYQIAPESITNSFYPEEINVLSEPFIIKDQRGATVYVYPFRYNAATQTLRVYKKLVFQIEENETTPINPLTKTSGKTFREMEAIYNAVFINYKSDVDDLSVAEAGDILVICTARDETAIQPYIDWKREKGFDVFKEVVATGTNVKSLIQQKYNSNPDLLYVQLAGDWADIKCDIGGGENAPMDPMLGCVSGSDYYPDISIGRFSASNAAQLGVQVNKLINYEQNPGGSWYANAIGVASNQGPGDDNEYDYQQVQVIYDSKLNPFTYNNYSYAYDPNASSTMVKNYINAGAGVINYCGHGSMTSWGSSGFSNSNVNTLTNGNMLPFIFSVACLNGKFHTGECFAEAWLKKEGGGAVMTLMSTINQPWDPPMRGQDYFNDLLTGGYNYSSNPGNGINTTEGRTTIGSIVANGLTLMYTESNTTADLQTIQTWTIFGDPSMQVRTKAPTAIALSNTTLFTGSPFTTIVSGSGKAIEGAMVCLSQNGIYESAYTNADGMVTLTNNFLPGDVQLVVTAFNTETIYQTIENEPLQADFSASSTQVQTGETVYFTNLSTGPMLSCAWDFDNDGTEDSQEENPNFVYNDPGIYTVSLTIYGSGGTSSQMIKENFIAVNAHTLNFIPVWETPFNPMTIYVTEAKVNGADLEAGAQIGIFDTDPNTSEEICVGTSTLSGVITQQDFLEIIASMNDGSNPDEANGFTPGHTFIFKFINGQGELIENVGFTFPFAGYDEVFASQGSAIVNLAAGMPPELHMLQLSEGWNAVSSYLLPVNPEMSQISSNISPQLEMIQNLIGFYQPGNSESSLTHWDYKSGYLLKVNENTTLTVTGTSPDDKTILLQAGWNLISVLSESDVEIISLFGENLAKVQIIKVPTGLNLYWPQMGISTLKTLKPGKAYLVKVTEGISVSF